MGARRDEWLAPVQRSGVTIMDRFLGEVKLEAPVRHVPVTHAPAANAPVANASIADAPGGKAAQASSRAKAAVLIACVLLGAYFYAAQEKKNAATAHAVQETLEQLAAGPADAAAQGRVFHDKQGNVYCGELGGHNARAAELRLKDGMRLFVCGPGRRAGGPPPR
jgi:hypothetical protein